MVDNTLTKAPIEVRNQRAEGNGEDIQANPPEVEQRFSSCIPPTTVLEGLDDFELESQIHLSVLLIRHNLIFHGGRIADEDIEEIFSHEVFHLEGSPRMKYMAESLKERILSLPILSILNNYSQLEKQIRKMRENGKSLDDMNKIVIQFSKNTLPLFEQLDESDKHAVLRYSAQSRKTITQLFASRSRTLDDEQTTTTYEYADYKAKHPKTDSSDLDSDD